MTDPVLIEVSRGAVVESRHRGAIVVVDPQGRRRAAVGDVGQAVFPRSAVKAIQALPLVESFGTDSQELFINKMEALLPQLTSLLESKRTGLTAGKN